MNSNSLLQLLPELLNRGPDRTTRRLGNWSADQVGSDQDRSTADSDETSQSCSDELEDEEQEYEEVDKSDVVVDIKAGSPKPVDLDEIEKFLDGITKSRRPQRIERASGGRPVGRDMAAILREVDDLGRRTLSSGSLPGTASSTGRPPPSPRGRTDPGTVSGIASGGAASGAASEPALLGDMTGRHVCFSQKQLRCNDSAAGLSSAPLSAASGKLSLSEPAIGTRGSSFHGLLSAEKRKNVNLTADMILLKQSNLENEIQLKTEWDDHMRTLVTENSSLKMQVEKLQTRRHLEGDGPRPDRDRGRVRDRRFEEQERLLDGFNAENSRLYRQLKQVKVERGEQETVIEDLQCDKRLLEARLQASKRTSRQPSLERQLDRREQQLELRWQELQQAGQEVARLHDKVLRRQADCCSTASIGCQTILPPSPQPRSPRSPRSARSPEHVAAAAAAEIRALKASLLEAEATLRDIDRQAVVREAEVKKACDIRVRALEGKLRRVSAGSPARADAALMAALRRLKAQLTEKERLVTQTRRQLEKSQRTVTGLQREREKLLLAAASRTPEKNGSRRGSRSRRSSPVQEDAHRSSPVRGHEPSCVRGDDSSPVRDDDCSPVRGRRSGHRVDDTLLMELQTAIAAVEEENVQLKLRLQQLTVYKEEEVSRRDRQIAALRQENYEVRTKLSARVAAPAEEEPELLSARSGTLLEEVRSQMEQQEDVINHLRETIRRFQEQTRLIAELEGENQTLRETVESLHWQVAKPRRDHDSGSDATQIHSIEAKLDEIDRQYRRRAAYLHAILQQLGNCNIVPRSPDGTSCR